MSIVLYLPSIVIARVCEAQGDIECGTKVYFTVLRCHSMQGSRSGRFSVSVSLKASVASLEKRNIGILSTQGPLVVRLK